MKYSLFLEIKRTVFTLVRSIFYPVLNTLFLALYPTFLISLGVFPSNLKQAKVIPVYKSDDETEPENYRPISLLSIFNRISKKLMYRQLKNFLDKHDILFKSQYGFSEKHSTQHAVIDIVNIIKNNMDLKLFTCGIFLN